MATKPEFKIITVRGKTTYAVTIPQSNDPVLDVQLLTRASDIFKFVRDEIALTRIEAEQEKLIPGCLDLLTPSATPAIKTPPDVHPGSYSNFVGHGEPAHVPKNGEQKPELTHRKPAERRAQGRSSVLIQLKTKPSYYQGILVDGYSTKVYWRCKHRHQTSRTADKCADTEAIRRSKSNRAVRY